MRPGRVSQNRGCGTDRRAVLLASGKGKHPGGSGQVSAEGNRSRTPDTDRSIWRRPLASMSRSPSTWATEEAFCCEAKSTGSTRGRTALSGLSITSRAPWARPEPIPSVAAVRCNCHSTWSQPLRSSRSATSRGYRRSTITRPERVASGASCLTEPAGKRRERN